MRSWVSYESEVEENRCCLSAAGGPPLGVSGVDGRSCGSRDVVRLAGFDFDFGTVAFVLLLLMEESVREVGRWR